MDLQQQEGRAMDDNGVKPGEPEDAQAAAGRGTGPGRSGRRRAVSLASVVAAAALGLAACGGGAASTSGAGAGGTGTAGAGGLHGASSAKPLEFARCMRAHGLTDFPDPVPGPDGYSFRIRTTPGSPMGPQAPRFRTAQNACKAFSPFGNLTPAQQAAANAKALKYSQCMRSHGIGSYPDPDGQGTIKVAAGPGIDPYSPRFKQATAACQSLNRGFSMQTVNFPS
jgi:hypothetical protein